MPLARTTPEPALDAAEEAALAVLLDCLSESRTMVVQAADPARARDLVRRLLTALPARLARSLSLSTFASEPDRSGLDLCVGVPPFSSARRIDVDLDGGDGFAGQFHVGCGRGRAGRLRSRRPSWTRPRPWPTWSAGPSSGPGG